MGVANIGRISEKLQVGGLAAHTPVAVIGDASLPTQQVLTSTLGEVADDMEQAGIKPPAITVVGDVAGLDLEHTSVHEPSDH